uniref:J domain-containing protein n=1 Tax=Panagrolaimus sp. ES5 TaxID=591445 RepID=A0AC34F403_9BILA
MDAEDIAQTKSLIDQFNLADLEDVEEDRKAIESYEVFSLHPGASKRAVADRYKHLALHFHPDKGKNEPLQYFQVISVCNEILSSRAPDEDAFESWKNLQNEIIIQELNAVVEERNNMIAQMEEDREQLLDRLEEAEKKNDAKDAKITALEKENKKLSNRAAKLKAEKENKVFEVEKILDKKGSGKKIEYLIKWRGFNDPKENTWVPVAKCNCPDLLAAFESYLKKKMTSLKKAGKPKPSSRSSRASTVIVKPEAGHQKSLRSDGKHKRKIIGKLKN